MGGADTVATAYSLAQAIRRIERDLLGGSRDYLIVTGMQSVDGDTAQVPPQIAEDLGIDQVAYAQDVHTEPELDVPPDRRGGHRGRRRRYELPGPRHRHRLHGHALPRVPQRPRRAQRRDPHVERGRRGCRPGQGGHQGLAHDGLPDLLPVRGPGEDLRDASATRPTCSRKLAGQVPPRVRRARGPRGGRLRARRPGAHLPRRVLDPRRARGRRHQVRLAGAAGQDPRARRVPRRAGGRRPALRRRGRPPGRAHRRTAPTPCTSIEHPLLASFSPIAVQDRRSPASSASTSPR